MAQESLDALGTSSPEDRSALDRLLEPEAPTGSWWEDPLANWYYYAPGNAALRWFWGGVRDLAGNATDDVSDLAETYVRAGGEIVDAGMDALGPAVQAGKEEIEEKGKRAAEEWGIGGAVKLGIGVAALATAAYVEATLGPLRALGRLVRR